MLARTTGIMGAGIVPRADEMVAPTPTLAETMCPLRFAQIRTGQPQNTMMLDSKSRNYCNISLPLNDRRSKRAKACWQQFGFRRVFAACEHRTLPQNPLAPAMKPGYCTVSVTVLMAVVLPEAPVTVTV